MTSPDDAGHGTAAGSDARGSTDSAAARRKAEARAGIRERLAALPPAAFLEAGEAVARHLRPRLEALAREWPGAPVGLFANLPREIRTGPLADVVRSLGLQRTLPTWNTGELLFHHLAPGEEIEELPRDALGIPTPTPDHPVVDVAELELIIVPGLAFDDEGYRLGQGGGFYDRALAPRDVGEPARQRPRPPSHGDSHPPYPPPEVQAISPRTGSAPPSALSDTPGDPSRTHSPPSTPESPLPRTIGIALDEQWVVRVVREAWDQPMDAVCTPKAGIVVRRR